MKVLHLTYSVKGGAGIAALRIHNALRDIGVDSTFLSTDFADHCKSPLVLNRNLEKAYQLPTKVISKFLHKMRFPHELMSGHRAPYTNLVSWINQEKFDIVNLHWTPGLVDHPRMLRDIQGKIVWTMHDMWPTMGTFHYLGDLERTNSMGKIFEKIALHRKRYISNSDIAFVSPSRWLEDKVHAYGNLKNNLVSVIQNPIPHFEGQRSSLTDTKKKVIFIAEDPTSVRKGAAIALSVIQSLVHRTDIEFMSLGKNPLPISTSNYRHLGYVANIQDILKTLAEADFTMIPSLEDNLPNVMMESLAVGTPVITFKNSGANEIIKSSLNGLIASDISADSLKTEILKACTEGVQWSAQKIKDNMTMQYSPQIIAASYLSLYNTVLNKGNRS